MKKFILCIAAAFAAISMFIGCSLEEKPATYTYNCVYQTNVSDTAVVNLIVREVKKVEYFQTSHEYTDTYSLATAAAGNDFVKACDLLDVDSYCKLIDEGCYFALYLVNQDRGAACYACVLEGEKEVLKEPISD